MAVALLLSMVVGIAVLASAAATPTYNLTHLGSTFDTRGHGYASRMVQVRSHDTTCTPS